MANSFIEVIPGHFYLNEYAKIIKDEIRKNNCVPFEFNTIGVDDGIAMGHSGMLYSLPSREIIANSIETVMSAHALDALICVPNCDKIVPGMLMGALRVNVPTIFVSGGPMRAGVGKNGEALDLNSAFEAVGAYETGKIDESELHAIECACCDGCGSASGSGLYVCLRGESRFALPEFAAASRREVFVVPRPPDGDAAAAGFSGLLV